ncbi:MULTISPECIES: type 3 dihydrofolate reductase [Idiomarinaceae]|uniref:Dihydrofolate reductase n=2 Tax=Pseudidiomarina TaxID=2800384 RepID=A0A368UL69_9GAMM|nr:MULTISPECIES: type 3 dihydrofolate reductase [Idiomarinaceae]MRJ41924.1 type 3 dihydrofolate reductase [Idiomarina sp. FeN1]NCU57207.1 type 3 dihydrofolate reductase [Idiomarina sp. FenA--70]NCU59916.1 type 3 dihydrofolate reductase [Idiomarina sp. FenBw--71]PWW09715.1 dihydrofolate reductase [Pseudidiomarina maritima]RBP87431.1 dihydrofolate reductase [Pseudidiomarina tainanensis]
MLIALVAAMAANRVIGKDGDMPWHLPAELKHFKQVTLGKPVVMGRTTYESIGRPLPGRTNIVLSRKHQQPYTDELGVIWVNSPHYAVQAAGHADELMVIGGGHVYAEFLPRADKLYLTKIDLDTAGDTYFPDYQAVADWDLIEAVEHPADASNPHAFVTEVYLRKS